MDSEQEIRLLFLDEGIDYLTQIESGILSLSGSQARNPKTLDLILRAAHSIKGGAAMMGYTTLSDLAHQLEDFLKIIKTSPASQFDKEIEKLLLKSVDYLRNVIGFYRQGQNNIESSWLDSTINPIFQKLYSRLGSPKPEDNVVLVKADTGENIVEILFSTEVDSCLERLEGVLQSQDQPCLKEEFLLAAQELGGLGEMLELSNFSSLCTSICDHLEKTDDANLVDLATKSLQTLRRSQALVLVEQLDQLPSSLEFNQKEDSKINIDLVQEKVEVGDLESNLIELESDILDSSFDVNLDFEDLSFLSEDNLLQENNSIVGLNHNGNGAVGNEFSTPINTRLELTLEDDSSIAQSSIIPQEDEHRSSVDKTIRVAVQQLEQLSDLAGELTIERNGLNLQLTLVRNLLNLLKNKVKILSQSNSYLRTAYDQSLITKLPEYPANKNINNLEFLLNKKLELKKESSDVPGSALSVLPDISSIDNLFDQIEMDRYSDLHWLFQELMETIVQIQEVTEDIDLKLEDTTKKARNVSRTSQLLQNQVTWVRMRPFSDLIKHFPRAVREMELKYGKQVQLKINGGGTLIDRTILEALKDPLIHLLRNAFDHGIEDPQTRIAQGKSPIGTIEVGAIHKGNQTLISLRDDGAGINCEKIRHYALKMGLDRSIIEKANHKELLDLIFEPGFSTASEVTDLSGRGVGMDIVRTQVKQIQGKIQIDTQLGEGTIFTIAVPFTLSVVRVLLVETGGMMFAFPSYSVEEMIISDPEIIITSAGSKYLTWDDTMIPLFCLREWLQFKRPCVKPQTDAVATINQPVVLIVAQGNELIGLEVESYWAEQEVSVRGIEGPIKLPTGFSGCTILGDGRVVPIVDVTGLLRTIEQKRYGLETTISWSDTDTPPDKSNLSYFDGDAEPITPEVDKFNGKSSSIESRNSTIMIVDDSINVRRFLALTLEKAGYKVQQAKDGLEAIEQLKKGLPIKAVICDLEMPRLDGYGFLAQIKSDPSYSSLPVIMLTSRNSEKHRQVAFNLGATAYFSKPFQTIELLQTLKSVISSEASLY